MGSHTPGPWLALEANRNESNGMWEAWVTYRGVQRFTCYESRKDVAEANARLVAAAPKLLEEIKAIGHQVQVDTGHFNRLQRLIESIEQNHRGIQE